MKASIYLDYAAATPVDEQVLKAMMPFYSDQFYNPSATYTAARKVSQSLDTARAQVAHWLGSRPSEIVFTAGGTEANNLAIHGVMRQFPEANIVVSSIEHESVLMPAHEYACREVQVTSEGVIDLDALEQAIDDKTVLVSVMYANNEIGTIEPLTEITTRLKAIRAARRAAGNQLPLYFHSDACQAANYLDLHMSRLGVDMITINGGKIYGPKQSGVLAIASHVQIHPIILGGGQERAIRSGTENVAQSIGLAYALELVQQQRHEEAARLQALQKHCFTLLEEKISGVSINGSRRKRLPNNVHITITGQDNERLLIELDEAGIIAAAGSACSASDEEPSHVLRALGLSDEAAQASLRFTFGKGTTTEAIETAVASLQSFIH